MLLNSQFAKHPQTKALSYNHIIMFSFFLFLPSNEHKKQQLHSINDVLTIRYS